MRPKNKTISAQDTHAQVSREKLLDAAISLVNESGMSSLTIRNICDKAGISTGSFYNLFEGKDDLVSYVMYSSPTSRKRKKRPQGVLRLRRSSSSIASISIASLKRDSNSSLASIQP